MILVTFVQTIDVMIDVPLKWPAAVRFVAAGCSIFNLNIELVKPECATADFDFSSKQKLALALPVIVPTYRASKTIALVMFCIFCALFNLHYYE